MFNDIEKIVNINKNTRLKILRVITRSQAFAALETVSIYGHIITMQREITTLTQQSHLLFFINIGIMYILT